MREMSTSWRSRLAFPPIKLLCGQAGEPTWPMENIDDFVVGLVQRHTEFVAGNVGCTRSSSPEDDAPLLPFRNVAAEQ